MRLLATKPFYRMRVGRLCYRCDGVLALPLPRDARDTG
jgi:hypothetical protein